MSRLRSLVFLIQQTKHNMGPRGAVSDSHSNPGIGGKSSFESQENLRSLLL